MKDLLLYIARNLVENPDAVSVTETENGDELTLELRVAPEDMGKVIGRQTKERTSPAALVLSFVWGVDCARRVRRGGYLVWCQRRGRPVFSSKTAARS